MASHSSVSRPFSSFANCFRVTFMSMSSSVTLPLSRGHALFARVSHRRASGYVRRLLPSHVLERAQNQLRCPSFTPHRSVDRQMIVRRIPPVGMIEGPHVVGPYPVHPYDPSFRFSPCESFSLHHTLDAHLRRS